MTCCSVPSCLRDCLFSFFRFGQIVSKQVKVMNEDQFINSKGISIPYPTHNYITNPLLHFEVNSCKEFQMSFFKL